MRLFFNVWGKTRQVSEENAHYEIHIKEDAEDHYERTEGKQKSSGSFLVRSCFSDVLILTSHARGRPFLCNGFINDYRWDKYFMLFTIMTIN